MVTTRGKDAGKLLGPLMTRRVVIGSGATVLGGAALTAWLGRPTLERWMHPLPAKRFVAVVGWPFPTDEHVAATITAAVDAISNELARAEAVDSNFYITSHHVGKDVTTMAQLNDIRESVGANLILAVSGTVQHNAVDLALHVVDPATTRTLRQETISAALDEKLSLPAKAVQTAAALLNISHYQPDAQRTAAGTYNNDAYNAFQAAQALRQQPNDTGLEQAIAKYQEAVALDPNYAKAYAQLAWAYCRYYYLHRNPSVLTLAIENCVHATDSDPQEVLAFLARGAVLEYRGDRDGAIRETGKALAIDPMDARTLVTQGELFTKCNRWADAEESFGRVIRLRPNYWWAHNELGVLYSFEGAYPKALDEFGAATVEVSKSAIAFDNLGLTHLQLGNRDEAVINLAKSIELQQTSDAAGDMAKALRAGAKYSEAIECYSSLPNGQNEAKSAYRKSAALKEADLQTNPTDGPGWMALALARIKAGSVLEVPQLLDKAEKNCDDDIDSQLRKSRILELLGRRDEALSTALRCLSRGGTKFQLETVDDLEPLLKDPRFEMMLKAG